MLGEWLFSSLKYFLKVWKKHRCTFSIFNIILTQPFYEFWLLNSFEFPNIDQNEKRSEYNKKGG